MNVKSGTIIRTIVLLVALVNQLLTATGRNPLPFSEEEMYQAFSAVLSAVTAIIAWWKNNSFSDAALKADEYMRSIREDEHNV